ncbi:MAG: hypothetical protein MUC85_04845 [Anaerolineales bacterium]|nr:hypothetical protein [Anaerolineales bacterium]
MSEITLSPAAFLKLLALQTSPALYLLTGESGVGKTGWCLELIRLAGAGGLHSAGLVSPAVFEMGAKTSIDLMEVASGERRRLATWRRDPDEQAGSHPLHWRFEAAALAWGNQILESLPASQLLLLDELGPLEFCQGGGLSAGLKRIDDRNDRTAVVVIRPALLGVAQARWHWAQVFAPARSTGEAQRI